MIMAQETRNVDYESMVEKYTFSQRVEADAQAAVLL
jgi:hypothetical protein